MTTFENSFPWQHSQLKILPLIILSIAHIFAWTTVDAFADGQDDETIKGLKAAIFAYNENHHCPLQKEYEILTYPIYCKRWCDIGWTCHGTKDNDPCKIDYSSDACHQAEEGTQACLQDMNDKNKTIIEYNNVVRQCHSPTKDDDLDKALRSATINAGEAAERNAADLDEAKSTHDTAINDAIEDHRKAVEDERRKLAEMAAEVEANRRKVQHQIDAERAAGAAGCNHPWYRSCTRGRAPNQPCVDELPGSTFHETPGVDRCCKRLLQQWYNVTCN